MKYTSTPLLFLFLTLSYQSFSSASGRTNSRDDCALMQKSHTGKPAFEAPVARHSDELLEMVLKRRGISWHGSARNLVAKQPPSLLPTWLARYGSQNARSLTLPTDAATDKDGNVYLTGFCF